MHAGLRDQAPSAKRPLPEHTEQRDMGDGFLIVACDGVWDEMSSEEAVHIVAKLILDNADDD